MVEEIMSGALNMTGVAKRLESVVDPAFLYSNVSEALRGENCQPQESIVVPIIIALISAIGLIANGTVILTVIVLNEYRKLVTNLYVLQLAIADFIFLFQLPFQVRTMLLGKWTYGSMWCKLSESIKMLNYYSSIIFLTVMSVDRSLAINFGMNQKVAKFRTKRAAFFISFIVWVLVLLTVINIMIYADVEGCQCGVIFPDEEAMLAKLREKHDEPVEDPVAYANLRQLTAATNYLANMEMEKMKGYNGSSGPSLNEDDLTPLFDGVNDKEGVRLCIFGYGNSFHTWVICTFTLAFLLPLLVICLSYALILRRIVRPLVVGKKSQPTNKTRKRATMMVIALVSAFTICWLPYHALRIATLYGVKMDNNACVGMANFTFVLAYSNGAINPFLYTFMGTNFRRRWGNAIEKARKLFKNSSSRSMHTHIIQTAETRL